MKPKDITGKKLGKLTAIKLDHIEGVSDQAKHLWLFKCDCGNNFITRKASFLNGTCKSCGCTRTNGEVVRHGMSYTRFYAIWKAMLSRIRNKKTVNYKYYGGRGIKVDIRWTRFENFRDDMFDSYTKHVEDFGEKQTSIDRIDTNKDYSKSNCRWATCRDQMNNCRRSVNHKIKSKTR